MPRAHTSDRASQVEPPAPAPAPAPARSPVVEPEPANSEVVEELGLSGAGPAAQASAPPPDAPESRTTFRCLLAGRSFELTCGAEPETIALAGFGGSFGHLDITRLVARVSAGDEGPVGEVHGRAVVAGSVECAVHGRFEGERLVLQVRWRGEQDLLPGLLLSRLDLDVDEGVHGDADAALHADGLQGPITLTWTEGRLVARSVVTAELPWLGQVPVQVEVDGFDLRGAADPSGRALALGEAAVQVTSGSIVLEGGRLRARVRAVFTDGSGALSGGLELSVDGGDEAVLTGRLLVALPGLATRVPVPLQARLGERVAATIDEIPLELADGAVSGSIAVTWTPEHGLSLEPRALQARLPGATDLGVSFTDLAFDAERGLSGSAQVPLEAAGVPWLEDAGVRSVSGGLSVELRDGELVAGEGTATVELDWGSVDVQIGGLSDTGLAARLVARITDLGSAVALDAPLVIVGEHRDGVTTLQASGLAFSVDLRAADLALIGRLSQTTLDQDGLSAGVSLELEGGLAGRATAEAQVQRGELTRADFRFPEPVFRFPADNPVVEGDLDGNLSFDQGRFRGALSGRGSLVGLDDVGEGGQV